MSPEMRLYLILLVAILGMILLIVASTRGPK